MNDDNRAYQATPHDLLISQIMDPTIPKNEREWAAAREIEKLRAKLSERNSYEEKIIFDSRFDG